MRVVVDFSVLRDLMSASPSYAEDLDKLKAMHDFGDVELWASSVSFSGLMALLERAVDEKAVRELLEDALTWLRICSVSESEIRATLTMPGSVFESRLDCVCACKVEADYIVVGDEGVAEMPPGPIPRGTVGEFMDYVSRKAGVNYAVVDF